MKIELTKDEILRFRYYLAHEIDMFQRDIEYHEMRKELDSLNIKFYQSHIEHNERFINKYSPTLDKLNKALEENNNDRS